MSTGPLMMDEPLFIATAVADLVSLGLRSTKDLYDFYTALSDRNEDFTKTVNQLAELLSVLRTVDDLVRTSLWAADEDSVLRLIEDSVLQCEDEIQGLEKKAESFRSEPTDSSFARVGVAGRPLAHPFRSSGLEELNDGIRRIDDSFVKVRELFKIKEQRSLQKEAELLKSMVQCMQATHLALDIRTWLQAPDVTIDYNTAASKRHVGTGQWFVQGQVLERWLQRDNSFLWLNGFAGCGKSVLCSTTIEHAFRRRQIQTQFHSAVGFFFFTFSDKSKQDASSLLRSLLAQLSGQVDGVQADLLHLKKNSNGGMPSIPTLLDCLKQAIPRTHHTYIFLDALDECPEGGSRDSVLDVITTMRAWSFPGLHLLTTSRDVVEIRDILNPQVQDTLELKHCDIQDDIRNYVSHCVEHDPRLRRWQDDCHIIKDYLSEHANGAFRWVHCQLEPLRRCPRSMYDLQQCLKRLPPTLDATYERMLSTIDVYSQERARRVLVLLCLAARDLSVAEVIEAIAVDVDGLERYDPIRRLSDSDDLLRICPGLIEITHMPTLITVTKQDSAADVANDNKGSRTLAASQIVRIAHFSVQEYLLSDRIRKGCAANFAVSEADGHAQISKTCLIYLCHEDFVERALTQQLIQRYALAKFAAQYWFVHFRWNSEKATQGAEELQAWAMTLCTSGAKLVRWVRLHDLEKDAWHRTIIYDNQDKIFSPPTYYLALLGIDNLLTKLLMHTKEDVNAQTGLYGSALQAAAARGHERVVRTLIAADADVNADGGRYGTSLQAASIHGHEKIVQMLLAVGANVNSFGGPFGEGSPLKAASANGRDKIVRMLLAAGADVNAQDDTNALYIATKRGYDKVVQSLLSAGADINVHGSAGDYLQVASEMGHAKVVQMLLVAGADFNAQNNCIALYAAAMNGHDKVVQILLAAGGNANSRRKVRSGKSALHAASARGHEEVVQILLAAGADVNMRVKPDKSNALYAAAAGGYGAIVRMLLAEGAEIDTQPEGLSAQYGRHSALYAASARGHEEVVQMLLAAGADVNARGDWKDSFSALQAASKFGHKKVVQMLTAAGAKVDV